MTKMFRAIAMAAGLVAATGPVNALYNDNITGNVVYISQTTPGAGYIAETYKFKLDNMPASPCITGGFMEFVVSSSSVPDAQTRRNFLSMLMAAKTSGATVTVAYDNVPGRFCDQGAYGIYYITLN